MNLEIVERGRAAKRLQEIPEFTQMLDAVKADIFRQFMQTNPSDEENRKELHLIVYGLQLLEKKVATYIDQGRFEQRDNEDQP